MDLISSKIGELSAVSAAILWAFTATFFTIAGKNIGSRYVNLLRVILASIFLTVTHKACYSTFFPTFSERSWFYLGLSGAIGLAVGDSFLFQSFLDIGTQKSMVIMSLWPVFSSILAFFFLKEKLSYMEILGIIITIFGISIVVKSKVETHLPQKPFRGVIFAFFAALCQAVGIIYAKEGLNYETNALSATVIRMFFATVTMIIFSLSLKVLKEETFFKLNFKGLLFTFLGAIVGPYLGVFLSLYAVSKAKVGVASALMTISPVILIPLSHYVLKDKIKKNLILGTLLTVSGSIILFLAKP